MNSCASPCPEMPGNHVVVSTTWQFTTIQLDFPRECLQKACAQTAIAHASATRPCKSLLDHARKEVDTERRKWEEAVVRLSRPKTCKQLQGLATMEGMEFFSPEHTTFGAACADEKGQGYNDDCARYTKVWRRIAI